MIFLKTGNTFKVFEDEYAFYNDNFRLDLKLPHQIYKADEFGVDVKRYDAITAQHVKKSNMIYYDTEIDKAKSTMKELEETLKKLQTERDSL